MATQVQIRRGTAAENDAFTGAQGELTYDTTNKRIRIHDGATAGGFELKTENSSGDTLFADNEKAIFGAGNDLQIYHSGTHSFIKESGTGNLKIQANEFDVINSTGSGVKITNVTDGAVKLGYGSGTAYKLETTSTGIDVTGTVTADGLTVDGSAEISSIRPILDMMCEGASNENLRIDVNVGTLRFRQLNDAKDSATERFHLDTNTGDISFYEDTGTTAKLFWDASAESLGIGTSSPVRPLSVKASQEQLTLSEGDLRGATFDYQSSTGALHISTNGANARTSPQLTLDLNGNVGIGTSSPSGSGWDESATVLHVYENTTNGGLLALESSNTKAILNAGNDQLAIFTTTADPIRIGTSGSERMRIDSSGNVGIGTSSPSSPLHVYEETANTTTTSDILRLESRSSGTTGVGFGGEIYFLGERNDGALQAMAKIIAVADVNSGANLSSALAFQTATSGIPTERMRIDSSGNVGIGTSSPLTVFDTKVNTDTHIGFSGTAEDEAFLIAFNDSGVRTPNISYGAASHKFLINTQEKMRIDSSGNVLVGVTSFSGNTNGKKISVSDNAILESSRGTTSSGSHIRFWNPNGIVGSITTSGSSTAYNTSSDYRLKTDVQPMTGATDRLKALNPVNFEWISSGERVDGFLAHEAQEVVPEAINGEKDAMKTEEYEVTPAVEATYDDEGNELTPAVEAVMGEREVPEYQGIDQSKLVPLLTAALQEAVAKIETLETRISTLEANQ